MISKICTIAFLVLIFTNNCFALGIGEWSAETPFGNYIRHDRESDLTSFNDQFGTLIVDSLNGWFFYKNHTIGSTLNGRYFVIDETSLSVKIFKEKSEWDAYTDKAHLAPALWARWYYDDWTYSKEDLWVALLLELIIGAIITGVIVLLKYFKKHTLKKPADLRMVLFRMSAVFIVLPITCTLINFLFSLNPASF